jgi:Cof subfamily protein (haloacid dehalogenase superfamily)
MAHGLKTMDHGPWTKNNYYMSIRALCSDIDGTLLNSSRELSPRTIAAVKRLPSKIPFILASSRMPSAMRHLQAQLGILHHPMICYNGGYVLHYDGPDDGPAVLDSVEIPVGICGVILELASGTDIHVSLYHQDQWFAPQADRWTAREERNTKVKATIADLSAVLAHWQQHELGAHKVMCMGPEAEIAQLRATLHQQYGTELHVYLSKSTYLEIAPRRISKATALQWLLKERYGISLDEVMAFGDNYNDIDMLQAVGKGIAVGNARAEVKAVVQEITHNSIEDGVAIAIEKYFAMTN